MASEDEKARIQSCPDPSLLDRWLRRAMTARATAEVFADS
jgi:hypothetical protein